jgi:hypothetical protein
MRTFVVGTTKIDVVAHISREDLELDRLVLSRFEGSETIANTAFQALVETAEKPQTTKRATPVRTRRHVVPRRSATRRETATSTVDESVAVARRRRRQSAALAKPAWSAWSG